MHRRQDNLRLEPFSKHQDRAGPGLSGYPLAVDPRAPRTSKIQIRTSDRQGGRFRVSAHGDGGLLRSDAGSSLQAGHGELAEGRRTERRGRERYTGGALNMQSKIPLKGRAAREKPSRADLLLASPLGSFLAAQSAARPRLSANPAGFRRSSGRTGSEITNPRRSPAGFRKYSSRLSRAIGESPLRSTGHVLLWADARSSDAVTL